ncbi:MAG: holo-ACP synthase [Acholeplasmataceae bacterium]
MIKGVGMDLVELERIRELLSDRFIERILSEKEMKEYQNLAHEQVKLEFIGGRFAAKEAIFKAVAVGPGNTNYKDFSVLHEPSGKPYVESTFFTNKEHVCVSITHTDSYAAAFVVIESKE